MSRWPNKYVIGLTGNIAVGKSVVRQMLQHLGAYTIDADSLAHRVIEPGAPGYKPVVEKFGQTVINPDQTINRTRLGEIVFNNQAAMQQLEAITHPIVRQAINTLVGRAKQQVVVIEAIKLLEGDLKDAVDTVWVVNASPKAQYTRLITKRKMTENQAKARMLSQGAQADKVKQANVVIQNDGNVEETWKQVQAAWGNLRQAASGGTAAPAQTQPQQQAKPETKPAPEQAKPAQTTSQPAATSTPTAAPAAEGITVKRGMPSNAEVIAGFVARATGKDVGRMDVIMSFGQKSYLLAESGDNTVGVAGWQVENLITRVDELYIQDGAPVANVIYALTSAIEDASMELQSEVSFIFLPLNAGDDMVQPFLQSGYELTTVKEIKIPAWREAVQEVFTEGQKILTRKLREDRVLKPI